MIEVGLTGTKFYPHFETKPDPYGVEKILKKADVDKSEAIYIGDSITDIETAKQ